MSTELEKQAPNAKDLDNIIYKKENEQKKVFEKDITQSFNRNEPNKIQCIIEKSKELKSFFENYDNL